MLERGSVVLSTGGRDSGKLLAVMRADEKTVTLCDGKERPTDRPKKKNIRHVAETGFTLKEEDLGTNRRLKKALAGIVINCNKQEG